MNIEIEGFKGLQCCEGSGTGTPLTRCSTGSRWGRTLRSGNPCRAGSAYAGFLVSMPVENSGLTVRLGPRVVVMQSGQVQRTFGGEQAGPRSLTLPGTWYPNPAVPVAGATYSYNHPSGAQTAPSASSCAYARAVEGGPTRRRERHTRVMARTGRTSFPKTRPALRRQSPGCTAVGFCLPSPRHYNRNWCNRNES